MPYPPSTLVFTLLAGGIAVVWFFSRLPHTTAANNQQVGAGLCCLRFVFCAVIVGTLYSSYTTMNHIDICDDSGQRCYKYEGVIQFSSFTRWCWMLEGFYFVVANLQYFGVVPSRCAQVLFGIAVAGAFLVTTATYGLLVPGALFLDNPPARIGMVTLLLSYQGHIMHILNSVFILAEMVLSGQQMQISDLPAGVAWCLCYVCFEWLSYHKTGVWHYPFLNYYQPFTEVIHLAFGVVFSAYWYLGCRTSERLSAKHHAS